jgi:hypothetical protein
LDYLGVRFADDGYDLRKLIRLVMTSKAYQSRGVVLEDDPGESYVYSGVLAKRMSAEQLLDSLWQLTGQHPEKAEAKVNRAVTAEEDGGIPDALRNAKVEASWIWHTGEVGTKSQLRRTFRLSTVPRAAFLMATCDNAFVMKINGRKVAESREWTKPVYLDVATFFQPGENLIEVEAEMFGGGAGFICQISMLGEGGELGQIRTDRRWEARPPNGAWAAAGEVAKHGADPWGVVLDSKAAVADQGVTPPVRAALVKNDFLMRSLGRPHRDQVVTSRPGDLTTLQAIDLSNGDIFGRYLRKGAEDLVKEGRSGEELVDWVFRSALSREPTEGERSVLLEVVGEGVDPVAVEDLLWMVVMLPEFQIIR